MMVADVNGFEDFGGVSVFGRDSETANAATTTTMKHGSVSLDADNRVNIENGKPQEMLEVNSKRTNQQNAKKKCKCWKGGSPQKNCECGANERLTFSGYNVDDVDERAKCEADKEKEGAIFFTTASCNCWIVTGMEKGYLVEFADDKKEENIVKCAPDDIDKATCNKLGCVYIVKIEGTCWDME